MTKNRELTALPRTDTGKEAARKLRAEGRIPAVLYGKEMEPKGISLSRHDTEYLFHRISVENTIVELALEEEKEPVQTLIREIQTLPDRPGIVHVDFLRIQKGVKVELDIPVHLEGVPIGVKESGGVLEQVVNEIKVKCIPSLIPEAAVLDVSGMAVGDVFHVSDLNLGEGVEILVEAERTICGVAVPKILVEPTEDEDEEGEDIEGVEGEEAPDDADGEGTSSDDGEQAGS